MIEHLGGAYERASALASRMNVPQEQLIERFEENAKRALEHEKAAKAYALEVVALLSERLKAQAVSPAALHIAQQSMHLPTHLLTYCTHLLTAQQSMHP